MNKQKGFTLIELMIVIAIIGILSAIALPSYQKSVMESRRADTKVALLSLANAMERSYTILNNYCDAAVASATSTCGNSSSDTGTPSIFTIPTEIPTYYTVTISAADASSFTLKALPVNTQASDSCGTLTLTNTGIKTPSTAGCW